MSVTVATRVAVLNRGLRCFWCRFTSDDPADFHVDHVIPHALGGSDDESNLEVACMSCNLARGAKDPARSHEWISRSLHFRLGDAWFTTTLAQMRAAYRNVRGGASWNPIS